MRMWHWSRRWKNNESSHLSIAEDSKASCSSFYWLQRKKNLEKQARPNKTSVKMNSSFSSIGKIISPHCPLIGSRFPAVHGLDQSQRSDCDHETERQKLEAKREKLRRGGAHESSGRIIWGRHQPTAVWTLGALTCCGRINTDVYASSDWVSRLWKCWRIFEFSIAVLWTRQVPQDLSTLWFNNEGSFGHLF